ncbi:hypothetical protein EW146_g6983 [Bondarzewia mesenterica]|uniref:Uncharacterized protein n=1 Tax=Bondarzewia mesenterica TaxID=1095465 RepID=A0A4S4LNZ8_9AGAM|nr:hypothetical protein EW146_g6983 [Bondarzewia mesenterica]
MTPVTCGSITLNPSNLFVYPVINSGLLNSDFDIYLIWEAIKAAKHIISIPAWKNYVIKLFRPLATAEMDEEIEAYARSHTVKGLRIINASVLPYVPLAHSKLQSMSSLNYLDLESLAALIEALKVFEDGVLIIIHNHDFSELICKEVCDVRRSSRGF